jgi:hypothetical protein
VRSAKAISGEGKKQQFAINPLLKGNNILDNHSMMFYNSLSLQTRTHNTSRGGPVLLQS